MTNLSQALSQSANTRPDKIAALFEDQTITYADLDLRSSQLANRLCDEGVGSGSLVGICVERSLDMLVCLLGTLKSGAAYVPLDPAYPSDRIAYMLEDSEAAIVLTQASLADSLPLGSTPCVCVDRDWDSIAQFASTAPEVMISADDRAYVIYTSGSTGRPKGVEIPHGAVMNFLESMASEPGLGEEDRLLAVTTLSFDIAGLELYLPLLVGAQLVLASSELAADGAKLTGEIEQRDITVMQATPATWRLLLEARWNGKPDMRILCGGETLSRDLAQQLIPRCAQLWNLYGPTETTIWSTVNCVEDGTGPVSIGHPILNTEIFILDDNLRPVPDGTAGELFIGGSGLALGYFKRGELTAERFIAHPLSDVAGARLYRTGDLAKILPDGKLEHMGRVDFQVKVRGFRIELGEIEAALERIEDIRQAAVLAREDSPGDKRLVAYIIAAGEAPSSRDLRNQLAASLPDYMVPGVFVTLEAFPLTPNGKVDRKAFPEPEPYRPELATEYMAPRDEAEQNLASIWAEVLRLERVGIDDNFFELGGDSLKVAQVATRVRDVFKVDMALRSLFQNPTVGSLIQVIREQEPAKQELQELPITSVRRGEKIPLAFAQERVWFIQQVNPQNLAYNFISEVHFEGSLNVVALECALNEILRRHESYRTSFPTVDGRPVQVVHPAQQYELPIVDLRGLDEKEQEAAAEKWAAKEYQLRFDLARIPLVRWHLLRYSDNRSTLIHMEHHLVHDGWSFNVFLVELVELYSAYSENRASPLEELSVQFAEFATWQREWMQGAVSDHQLDYWREKFATIPPVLELPTKGARPSMQSFVGASERPEIPLQLCNDLRALSRAEGSTLFMTMLSAYIALLHRYTGETDIAVGTFFANRRAKESEGLIGMILNNVVVRSSLDKNPTGRELITMVRDTVLEGAHYQDVPFDRVVEAVQPKRDFSSNPLFQLMFSFHDEPMPENTVPGLDIRLKPVISNGSAKFDLGVIGIPHSAQVVGLKQGSDQDGLTMIWEYNTDLFETSTIKRMIEHYISLLTDLVTDPEQRVSELTLCSEQESKQSLVDWNRTEAAFSSEKCLHQLIEAQAAAVPDNTAVVFETRELSYADLDARANQLANFLYGRGVRSGDLVGICMERSEKMLVSLLAALKAGATYIPMDPAFPADRLSFMVEDAQIPVLITEGGICDCLESDSTSVIRLDRESQAIAAEAEAFSNPQPPVATDLAYIIYTSGSTGRPKGVQISHRALVNFLESMAQEPGIQSTDRLFAVTTISFDIAGLELYLPLISGARVIIGSRSAAIDGEELAAQLESHGATVMQATPTTWQLLIESGWQGNAGLTALCGGEALPRTLAGELLPRVGCLWNMYGPTETTIWSTIHRLDSAEGAVPIGRPIANTEIYILDSYGNPAPIGVTGELCIGGAGLADGYLNRPELTAEKFIENAMKPGTGERIYHTGDLARYRADGTLECLGRVDHQIKLRGYRIELGEIESLLDNIEGISQSVVIAREDQPGIKRLVAYVVCNSSDELSPNTILSRLREDLPDYMVPGVCMILDELPLTPNGKVDRLALPVPGAQKQAQESTFLAPRTPLEETLVDIWQGMLDLSGIGVRDDFFDVGGHSILAVRLVSEIESRTGKKIPVAALLQGRTIEYVANALSSGEPGAESGLVPLQTGGDIAPLFMIGSHPRYTEIPKKLGSRQPVYQLDMYALLSIRKAKGLPPLTRIEEYAEYYLEEITKLRPHGPYNLAGGCEGAYLAYEIAVRLQQRGEVVRRLVMWIPPPLRESMGFSLRRFAWWQSLQRFRFLLTGGSFKNISRQELGILLEHERLEYRIIQALCSYNPQQKFEGDITLVRTEEAPYNWKNDINQPWKERASGGADIQVVRGNHQNWLYEYVDDLSHILKSRLDKSKA